MGLVGVANRNDEPSPRLYKQPKPKAPDAIKYDSDLIEQEVIEESEQAIEAGDNYFSLQ